jgi:hypothetical protein
MNDSTGRRKWTCSIFNHRERGEHRVREGKTTIGISFSVSPVRSNLRFAAVFFGEDPGRVSGTQKTKGVVLWK